MFRALLRPLLQLQEQVAALHLLTLPIASPATVPARFALTDASARVDDQAQARSHNRTVLSPQEVASVRPSGLNAIECTGPVWPCRIPVT